MTPPLPTGLPTDLPDGPRGRILALAIAGVLLIVLWFVGAGLVGLYRQGARDLDDRREILAHTRALVDSLPDLTLRVQNLSRAAQGNTMLVNETSQDTALARVQQIAHDIAVQDGVTPTSMEPLPVTRTGRFERLGVHLTATTAYPDLIHLLQTLAQGTAPRLLVDDLHITLSDAPPQATGGQNPAAQGANGPQQGQALDISLTIFALRDPSVHTDTTPPTSSPADTGASH